MDFNQIKTEKTKSRATVFIIYIFLYLRGVSYIENQIVTSRKATFYKRKATFYKRKATFYKRKATFYKRKATSLKIGCFLKKFLYYCKNKLNTSYGTS
jgi:hypothetical protein